MNKNLIIIIILVRFSVQDYSVYENFTYFINDNQTFKTKIHCPINISENYLIKWSDSLNTNFNDFNLTVFDIYFTKPVNYTAYCDVRIKNHKHKHSSYSMYYAIVSVHIIENSTIVNTAKLAAFSNFSAKNSKRILFFFIFKLIAVFLIIFIVFVSVILVQNNINYFK
jgi:hypothetical protein